MILPHETGCADDISFYSTSKQWLDASLPLIANGNGLDKWSLRVNRKKTEWIRVTSASKEWRVSKQLRSLLGEEEDARWWIEQASRTYDRMYSLWLRNHIIPEKIRLRLYNAIVLPTLLHNCETWGPTAVIMNRLDAFHRKQLRALLEIRHPRHISNEDLFERTNSKPLSEIVSHCRHRMTGHI